MSTLENGAYEIIRQRLTQQAEELNERLHNLNDARKGLFGALERKLLATDRISTSNHCIARDVVAIGGRCIFGYNVQLGLKSGIELADVFNVYNFHGDHFEDEGLHLISDKDFETDFKNLYRYYKEASFSRFALRDSRLYMVFQLQPNAPDFKAFKWQFGPEGEIRYVDNRSEHELTAIPQYEFNWKRATRDDQRKGQHPHVSILDRLFVDTLNGTLNVKVEDNTRDGRGIYSEPVEQRDQTLDDAEFSYADLGSLIALRVRPYQEPDRYFVFNEKMQELRRINSLASSGVLLPDDHGLIFANGYYLQTGAYKQFENIPEELPFKKRIASPNGEDFLYVFYQAHSGLYTLLFYNLIEQQVVTPITCNGYAIFPDGQLCLFRAEAEPVRHHQMQIWQTPFTAELALVKDQSDKLLYKVGNKDIVRAMAECREIITLTRKDDAYTNLYEELSRRCRNTLDTYHWLNKKEAFELHKPLSELLQTAETAIEEYVRKRGRELQTKDASKAVEAEAKSIFKTIDRESFSDIDSFVQTLGQLRGLRGAIIGLRELPYHDPEQIDRLDASAKKHQEQLAEACIRFLLKEEALLPYRERLQEAGKGFPALGLARDAVALEETLDAIGEGIALLMDVVNNLSIADATQSAAITERISELFTELNQLKAQLRQRRNALQRQESEVEFAAQLKLMEQSRLHFMQQADSPEKCDEYLSRILIQLEELEGRFAEVEAFVEVLSEQREGVLRAFDEQRQHLVAQRNNRTAALQKAGERILQSIRQRVSHLESEADIQSFFAADLLVDKVRSTIERLRSQNDSNKADGLQTQLSSLEQEALRQWRDKKDLYVDGQSVIQLGRHRFSVNVQNLELTSVFDGEQLLLHLTGTDFYEPLRDATLEQVRSVWAQVLPSENNEVARAEFLAYQLFLQAQPDWEASAEFLLPKVQAYASTRYQEGYTKGVHDEDAARMLAVLLEQDRSLGLLRYLPEVRALARYAWVQLFEPEARMLLEQQLSSAQSLHAAFAAPPAFEYLIRELEEMLSSVWKTQNLYDSARLSSMAGYLFAERSQPEPGFVLSAEAIALLAHFDKRLKANALKKNFNDALKALDGQPYSRLQLARQWLLACRDQDMPGLENGVVLEAAVQLLCSDQEAARPAEGSSSVELQGLRSEHSKIPDGVYTLHYHNFIERLQRFQQETLLAFELFSRRRRELLVHYRDELQLEEFEPQVLSSFVRNRLIDQVYLPLFGDNLAKQIGTAGTDSRTDRNGMLLLISPPGYGKTTLMEYLAQRLGLTFVKVNGPALGHSVKSLAPEDAPSLAARKELQKLNLAFEMGDNLMLYIDDIQHCHSEFLQRFISLCDAQRKVEGVYRGRPKTYDLRGKRVCVVMAGNPYTEQGERFQIPDMLANRADIYNLGDIIGDSEAVFRLSYIENALTANPTLKKLAARNMQDVYALLDFIREGEEGSPQLEAAHSPQEVQEYLQVLRKLLKVRDAVLAVNQEYIRSAGMSDDYREEPPFRLQGSYRNMNKLAERILPIINETELRTLLLSHYEGEVQTLRQDAEANMLKLRELFGVLTPEQQMRLDSIRNTFRKNRMFRGNNAGDPMMLALAQLGQLNDELKGIREALNK